jgi:hypothetical protein
MTGDIKVKLKTGRPKRIVPKIKDTLTSRTIDLQNRNEPSPELTTKKIWGKFNKLPTEESVQKRIQFGIWMGIPAYARDPQLQTIEQIGYKLGVSKETIRAWKKDKFVLQIAENAVKIHAGTHKFSIVNKMIEQAEAGDHNAQKLYLDYMGELGSSRYEPKDRGVKKEKELNITLKKAAGKQ